MQLAAVADSAEMREFLSLDSESNDAHTGEPSGDVVRGGGGSGETAVESNGRRIGAKEGGGNGGESGGGDGHLKGANLFPSQRF